MAKSTIDNHETKESESELKCRDITRPMQVNSERGIHRVLENIAKEYTSLPHPWDLKTVK